MIRSLRPFARLVGNSMISRVVVLLCLALVVGCGGGEYPSKTVTIICPWATGGGTDQVARFWAEALQKEHGSSFVVVNRTGGGGATGHSAGARAQADGYTMTMITFELCTIHRIYSKEFSSLTYENYECLLQVNADPAAIIVRNDSPWKTLSDFLDAVKKQPGTLKMSGTATGGAWDLARGGMLMAAGQKVDDVRWIPTKGAAPSLKELMAGEVDAVCCSVPEAAPQLESGQLRVLCVMSEERLQKYADVPTAKEQGVEWVAVGWRGLALPKNTPTEIVTRLKASCEKIAKSEEYKQFMDKRGFGIAVRTGDEFRNFLTAQDEQWAKVVEAAGLGQ